jgi:hypothetical protein
MLEILTFIINTLKNSTGVTSIVPATQILVGQVDIVEETQAGLQLPQINAHVVSESTRTVPTNARDTMVQVDIWSRNSMMEVVQVYEFILQALNYSIANVNTAHIFWDRSSSCVDMFESDRTIWHRAVTFEFWSMKP